MNDVNKDDKYYGRRGNEIVKIEGTEDRVDVKIVLPEGWDNEIYVLKTSSIPKEIVSIQKNNGKLKLWADKSKLRNDQRMKGIGIAHSVCEGLLWEKPEEHFNTDDEYERVELECLYEAKRVLEEFSMIPKDELWDMDITVVTEGAIGRYNCMSSIEDGYEKASAKRVKDSSKTANPIRKLNSKFFPPIDAPDRDSFDIKAIGAEYMRTLKELTERDTIGDIDANDIKFAMQFAFDHRRGFDDSKEEEKQCLINAIKNLISNRDTPEEEREIWIRGLSTSLYDFEVKEYVKQITLKEFNRFYLPALEKEANETPGSKLMCWYKECLDMNVSYRQECIMYNRLAYFYLWHYALQNAMKQAKAYFMAMERRGILFDNPYKNYYDNNRHTELINALLEGGHEDEWGLYMEEYYRKLKSNNKEA